MADRIMALLLTISYNFLTITTVVLCCSINLLLIAYDGLTGNPSETKDWIDSGT